MLSLLFLMMLIKLWHLRLGHLPFSQLKHVFPDMNNTHDLDCICQVCPKAKQCRNNCPISTTSTDRPFQLLHIDIWGAYKHPTINGCKFFLTIVDDFTRYTWVHFLKFKYDVLPILIHYVAYVENQFSCLINTIIIDNAKQFCEGSMLQFYL